MSIISDIAGSAINSALGNLAGGSDSSMQLGSISFPILPSDIEVSVKQNNGSVNINNFGEYNMLGKTGLKNCTVASFWPADDYSFAVASASMTPDEFVSKIEEMRTAGTVSDFSLSGSPISFKCTVDSFTYGYKDSSDDIYFTLGLREYRYIEGTAPQNLDSLTGLNKRPLSFLQKVAKNVHYYPGDNPLTSISRAVGAAAGATKECLPYLKAYRTVMKHGGITPGSVLQAASKTIKIDGVDVTKIIMH